jgi:hypothetical protein
VDFVKESEECSAVDVCIDSLVVHFFIFYILGLHIASTNELEKL